MFSSDLSAFISWKGGRRARPGTGENLRYFYSLMERARESLGSSGDWQTGLRYGATVSGRGWCRGNHWCITGRVSKKKGVQDTIITSWRVAKWINYLEFFLSCTELFHVWAIIGLSFLGHQKWKIDGHCSSELFENKRQWDAVRNEADTLTRTDEMDTVWRKRQEP